MKKVLLSLLLILGIGLADVPKKCICGQNFGHPVPAGSDLGAHGGWMDSD